MKERRIQYLQQELNELKVITEPNHIDINPEEMSKDFKNAREKMEELIVKWLVG